MARLRRDLEPVAPTNVLPDNLARFVFEEWARPEDGAAHADGFGIMGEFIAAETRWGAAIREWAKVHDITLREARALVHTPSNWNEYVRLYLSS